MTDRPPLREIIRRVESDLAPVLSCSSNKGLSRAVAGCAHLLYGYARGLADSLHPLRAEGPALSDWADIWLGKDGRKPAASARGALMIQATQKTELPAGTVFLLGEQEFAAVRDYVVSDSCEVKIKALKPGYIPPVPQGTILRTARTIAGIKTEAHVSQEISGGADPESDSELRERMTDRVRNPPRGGSPQDYIAWAESVPGISRAWVAPKVLGKGTVGVAFVDDKNGGVSVRAAGELLLKKLEECGPAATEFVLLMLEAEPVHFRIESDPVAAKEKMIPELQALIRKMSEPSMVRGQNFLSASGHKTTGILRVSDIHEALAVVRKKSFRLLYPDQDLTVSEGKIFTFGGLS